MLLSASTTDNIKDYSLNKKTATSLSTLLKYIIFKEVNGCRALLFLILNCITFNGTQYNFAHVSLCRECWLLLVTKRPVYITSVRNLWVVYGVLYNYEFTISRIQNFCCFSIKEIYFQGCKYCSFLHFSHCFRRTFRGLRCWYIWCVLVLIKLFIIKILAMTIKSMLLFRKRALYDVLA